MILAFRERPFTHDSIQRLLEASELIVSVERFSPVIPSATQRVLRIKQPGYVDIERLAS
jgi:hypothetical protein